MLDTKIGRQEKDDPVEVARIGFGSDDARRRRDRERWKNKLQSALVAVTPAGALAEMHRRKARPARE